MSSIGALRIGLAALAFGNIVLACAGGDEPEKTSESPEASVYPADAGLSDATTDSPEVDAGMDADTCSASKLCVTAVPIDGTISLTSMWGTSATDVWAVGSSGTVLHHDGVVWEKADRVAPDGSTFFTLRSVWTGRSDEVWIADGPSIRRGTGWKGPSATEWSFFTYPIADEIPAAIRGTASSVWVARGLKFGFADPLSKFEGWVDGGPFAPQRVATSISDSLGAIAVSSPNEVWATSSQNARVFRVSLPARDGGAPDAAPPTWQVEESDSRTTAALLGVWGDESAVWLVGVGGTLRRMTRDALPTRTFEIVPSPVTADLHGVFGFGADDVWAVGEGSTVLHWDGTTWTKLSTPFDDASNKPRLLSVWGSSPTDVWISGDGTMLHLSENP